jgi:dolichol kinase
VSSIPDSTGSTPRSPTERSDQAPARVAARKGLHAGLSVGAALVVWALPHPAGAAVVAGAAAAALAVEIARRSSPTFALLFHRNLGRMLRPSEATSLTGATYLALGFTIPVALLPGWPAIAGILVAGLADPLAAAVGRSAGRHRYAGGKSLEGSAAFLAASAAILWAVPGIGFAPAAAAAAALALAEAPSLRVDDNLYLPALAAVLAAVALAG